MLQITFLVQTRVVQPTAFVLSMTSCILFASHIFLSLIIVFKNGTLTIGFGAGSGYSSYIVTPLDALKARAIEDNHKVRGSTRNVYCSFTFNSSQVQAVVADSTSATATAVI